MKNGVIKQKSNISTFPFYQGESIEEKIRRIGITGEPISAEAPEIYQERKDGVDAGCDIRTDRWDVALEAQDAIARTIIAGRANKQDIPMAVETMKPTFVTDEDNNVTTE